MFILALLRITGASWRDDLFLICLNSAEFYVYTNHNLWGSVKPVVGLKILKTSIAISFFFLLSNEFYFENIAVVWLPSTATFVLRNAESFRCHSCIPSQQKKKKKILWWWMNVVIECLSNSAQATNGLPCERLKDNTWLIIRMSSNVKTRFFLASWSISLSQSFSVFLSCRDVWKRMSIDSGRKK